MVDAVRPVLTRHGVEFPTRRNPGKYKHNIEHTEASFPRKRG